MVVIPMPFVPPMAGIVELPFVARVVSGEVANSVGNELSGHHELPFPEKSIPTAHFRLFQTSKILPVKEIGELGEMVEIVELVELVKVGELVKVVKVVKCPNSSATLFETASTMSDPSCKTKSTLPYPFVISETPTSRARVSVAPKSSG